MIIISNGFSKFHLSAAAAEADRRGLLNLFITGAYPTPAMQGFISLISGWRWRKLDRFRARGEKIDNGRVRPQLFAEALYNLRIPCHRLRLHKLGEWIDVQSFKSYGASAARILSGEGLDAKIYHYRAGFGGASIAVAKKCGLVMLCDHSIAHPAVLQYLIENNGRLPPKGKKGKINLLWRHILEDIEQADAILVNSDFVKETFLHQGWDPSKVHVIYLGVDDVFLESLAPPHDLMTRRLEKSDIEITFAGAFERRKGAKELASAVSLLGEKDVNFKMNIAGGVSRDSLDLFKVLQRSPRVQCYGFLSRKKLAELLCRTDIFVFPSLAEGSARVIFEALACGCYVVTTPNSGSIVEDGVHGKVISPGDTKSLATALSQAVLLGRETLAEIGVSNAQLVRDQYRQSQYGDKLVALYEKL